MISYIEITPNKQLVEHQIAEDQISDLYDTICDAIELSDLQALALDRIVKIQDTYYWLFYNDGMPGMDNSPKFLVALFPDVIKEVDHCTEKYVDTLTESCVAVIKDMFCK